MSHRREGTTISSERRDGSRVSIRYRGTRLLNHPVYNKSTAFSREERAMFGLEGLLPDTVTSMQDQAQRAYLNIARKTDPLEKYIGLAALQDRNEHLFYRVLIDHIEEFLPIVYTPTVGQACREYSRIFRRARGLWVTPRQRGRIDEVLGNTPSEEVRLIVATDNERILGLGDQGAGGMGIPVGKLALYTAAAGIPPVFTLPVSLDVGTDNPDLLEDELYIGWRGPRLRGEEYDSLVAEFVAAVKRRFPRALLQWEDLKQANAFRLLDRYRHALPSFNDDIQGTGAMVAAAVMTAARLTGRPLTEQRAVVLGGGAAGVGIAQMLRAAFSEAGLSHEALSRSVAVLDLQGVLVDDGELEPFRRSVAWPPDLAEREGLRTGGTDHLIAAVEALHPTILVGASGSPGAFGQDVVRRMAAHVERPLILPVSNPTSHSEAKPADLIEWTDGRALVATGSPFPPVQHEGRSIRIGQANNAFVFPGVGLGVLVAEAPQVTDGMFLAAARALSSATPEDEARGGSLFPRMSELRDTTAVVARAVVREARDKGISRFLSDDEIRRTVDESMWQPFYPELEPA